MVRTSKRDPIGMAVGFALGGFVGLALATPALPRGTSLLVGNVQLGPTELALLLGAVAVVSLPLLVVVINVLFPGT